MSLSNADKQARYRAHKAGDHETCAPDRECRTGKPRRKVRSAPALDESVGPGRGAALPTLDGPASTRSERSRELWAELAPRLSSPYRVLLSEACRIADRLDRLDAIIDGNDEWLVVKVDPGGEIVVAVDASLAEARQQATTLRALLAEIVKGLPAAKPEPTARSGGIASLADAAARRRAAR